MIKKYLFPIIGFLFGGLLGLVACHYAICLVGDQSIILLIGYLIVLFIFMFIIYFIEIFIHESGHLVCGLLSGYHFLSFRIFNWILIKKQRHYQIKKYSLLSTAGQCLLAPPDYNEGQFPCLLYHLGGILFDGFSLIIFLTFYFHTQGIFNYICLVFVLFAFLNIITNGIPISNAIMVNDGYNVMHLNKDPLTKYAFWLQMYIYQKLVEEKSLRDIDASYFDLPSFDLLTNGLSATLAVLRCNYLMEKHCFDEAQDLIQQVMTLPILGIHRYLLQLDLIYIAIINGNFKQAISYKTKELDSVIKQMKNNPSIIRFQYAYALKCEQNKQKANQLAKQFNHLQQSYPYLVELKVEAEYMNLIKEME